MPCELDNIIFTSPDAFKTSPETETEKSLKSKNEPEQTPKKEPGDGYTITAAILGILIGGAVGFFIAKDVAGIFLTVICVIGGMLIGGSAGGLIGERIRKSINEHRQGNGYD